MSQTMSDDDGAAKDILNEVEKIIEGAADSQSIENVFTIAAKVGSWLIAYRQMLIEGKFSAEFAEDICTMLFQKFFPPPIGGWAPDYTQDEE